MTSEAIPRHPCYAPSIISYPVYLGDFGGWVAFGEARRVDWWARCRSKLPALCTLACPSIAPPRPTPTSAYADIVRCPHHPRDYYAERFNRSASCGPGEPKCDAGTPPA